MLFLERLSGLKRFSDGRGVVASTATSILVRLASATTTLIAMPIALRTLGDQRFGTYLLLFGILTWINLGSFGVHSALGRLIAAKEIALTEVRDMLGAALIYAAVTTVITASVVATAFYWWLQQQSHWLAGTTQEVGAAGLAMIILLVLQMILQAFEGVRIGTLKLYLANVVRLAGSCFSFIALLAMPHFWPYIITFVLAINGGLVLSALINAILVIRDTPPRFSNIRTNLYRLRHLAVSGLAFLIIGIASLFQTQLPILIVASQHGPASIIDFGLFIRLLSVLMTGLTMVSTPFWPAFMAAHAELDMAWIKRNATIAGVVICGGGFIAFLAVAMQGSTIVRLWTGRLLLEPRSFQILFGLYFFQMAWSHYWQTIMIGLKHERLVSIIFIVEGTIMVTAGSLLSLKYGQTGMIFGMVFGFAIMSNWLFPVFCIRKLSNIFSSEHGGFGKPKSA